MKTDRKIQVDKKSPKPKAVKGSRRAAKSPSSNGKHPPAPYEHAPIGIVEASLEGKYINVNEEFCRITGYEKKDLLRYGIKDLTHEDDYALDVRLHERLVAGEIPFYKLEKRFMRKDGGSIWAELTRSVVRDEKGKALYTVGVVLDISDRKHVERVLRESVEKLRLATESARMYMWEWDFQRQIYTVADSFEQVIGFSAGLLPQNDLETVLRLFSAEDRQAIIEAVEHAVESHSDLQALQCRLVDPDSGQMAWLEVNGKVVYDEADNAVRMFGVAQNITASKKAESALHVARTQAERSAERTARLQKVTAALSEALTPPQVAEVLAKQGAPGFGAVSSSMMLLSEDGETLQLMYSTTDEHLVRPYQRFPVSLRVPAADAIRSGELVWLESRQQYLERYPHLMDQIHLWGQQAAIAVPMVYEDRILGVFTLSFAQVLPYNMEDRDYVLTLARQGAQALERARAEDALRESEERFRALVSQATAGISETDMDGVLTFINPRFCEMLGYPKEELLGRTIWEFTHADDLPENQRLFQRMLSEGRSYQFEKRFIRKNGASLWTNVTVSTIRDLAGNSKGGVGVIIDIEERKRAEIALTEFAREQEALYKFVDQLHRTSSFEDIYSAALDAILSALQCDRASILLFDHSNVMRFVAWRGLSDAYRSATDGHSPWAADAVNPQPISMNNVGTAELSDWLRDVVEKEGIRSLAFIPLVSNGRLIGKFMVYFNEPHVFKEDELDLSLTIARQLAFGVERKRAENALRVRASQQQAVARLGELALREHDLQKVFDYATAVVAETLEVEYCKVLELLEGKAQLLLRSGVGWNTGLVGNATVSTNLDSQAGYTLISNTPVLVTDLREESRFSGPPLLVEHGVISGLSCIIRRADGEPWGVLGAHTSRRTTFTQDDLSFLTVMANILSDAIQRHQAEQALREGEERYRAVVESQVEMLCRFQPDGKILFVNGAYARARATTPEVLISQNFWEFISEADRPNVRAMLASLTPADPEIQIENRFQTADGERWTLWTNRALKFDASGQLLEVQSSGIDITERKRAEEALLESEERYRGIFNQTIAGIAETDLTGKFTMVNDRYCELTGYPSEELLDGMRMQSITHPDDQAKTQELFARLASDGTSFEIEKRYIRPDGQIAWVHNSVSALISAEGKPQSAVAVVIDVAERKRAEETLRRNEELFSTLIQTAPFGVYFIDSEFRLRAINKGSEAVFQGVSPLIGRDFAEILRIVWQEPFATEAIERFRHTLRTGESFISEPTIEPRGNIEEIQSYDWQIHRITMPDGSFGVVCYFYDLSEQKRMEATVRASEALYRAIAGNIPGGGVYVVDKDFRYLVAEGPVTEAFGLSREMVEGHTVMEVFPGERGERMVDRLKRNFAGETISFETKHDGRVYWTRQAPLSDSIGHAIMLTLDITERKQAEEALRQSEERFRAILRQATAGIVRKDEEGRLVFVNQAFCNMLGYTEAELLGRTMWELMHEDDVAENKRSYDRMITEGVPFKLERRLIRQDGSVIWVDASVSPIMDPEGKLQSAVAVEVDITARKLAEEAVAADLNDMQVLRDLGMLVSEGDIQVLYQELVRAAIALTQADAGTVQLLDEATGELVLLETVGLEPKMIEHFHRVSAGSNTSCGIALARKQRAVVDFDVPDSDDPDGSRRMHMEAGFLSAQSTPLITRSGRSIGMISTHWRTHRRPTERELRYLDLLARQATDLIERKQAEDALQQLNLQLEERVLSRTAKLRTVNQTLREEITERKRVEEALRQSEAIAHENEAKLRSLFDLLPVGISFLNPEGQVIQMNSALLDILKLSKDQLLGKTHTDRKYIRADGTPMPPSEFASVRAIAENRTVYNVETGVVLEGGGVIWTSVSAAPVDVADVGIVVVTVDITDNKRAEQALQESHARLRILSQRLVEVQEEERRALARELHDRVGQTLAALNINLIIINSQLSTDVAEQIGSRLNDSMKLVAETIALVRDVMTDLRPAVLDDYGLEAALESHLSQFIARYEINAKFEKPAQPLPRLGASVEMTFLRIAQEALMNIARHAQATQIHLSLQEDGDAVCMTIRDNGIGIQSWQEANRPGSHGLTIMRERAEAFDGNLHVRSVPGQGTRIEVSIPVRGHKKGRQETIS